MKIENQEMNDAQAVTVDTPQFLGRITCCILAPDDEKDAEIAGLITHIDTWQRDVTAQALEAERSAKETVMQNAKVLAQEMRTQRSTVCDILEHFGCPNEDWHALELVKAASAQLVADANNRRAAAFESMHSDVEALGAARLEVISLKEQLRLHRMNEAIRASLPTRLVTPVAAAAPQGTHRYYAIGKHIFVDEGGIERSRVAEFYLPGRAAEFVNALAERDHLRSVMSARTSADAAPVDAKPVAEWVNDEQGFQRLNSERLPDGTQLYTAQPFSAQGDALLQKDDECISFQEIIAAIRQVQDSYQQGRAAGIRDAAKFVDPAPDLAYDELNEHGKERRNLAAAIRALNK